MDQLWKNLSGIMALSMRMTATEAEHFHSNTVAKLIGLLPFLAGCDDAERTALSHLATFVIAGRGDSRRVFDHGQSDDVEPLARLRTISDFKGGTDAVIERGMVLLCLCMVCGYERDIELDEKQGAYNPIASGAWDIGAIKEKLEIALARFADPDIDLVMTQDDASRIFWEE